MIITTVIRMIQPKLRRMVCYISHFVISNKSFVIRVDINQCQSYPCTQWDKSYNCMIYLYFMIPNISLLSVQTIIITAIIKSNV